MSATVTLIGLDFGTTTSSAVVASARLTRNSVTGRTDLDQVRERYRSDMVFTPLRDDGLDEQALEKYLDAWLAAGEVRPEEVFGGGALLTGLTAQKANAAGLVRLIRRRLGNALVATADDPCLESWLAFMGSCAGLSREHPDRAVLNLDVGGGTTNLALGRAGDVLRTGCLFVGARHVQLEPGGYRIVKLSRYAHALLDHLGIRKAPGASLTAGDVDALLDFYMTLLEGAATGNLAPFQTPVGSLHQQVALHMPGDMTDVLVTVSGGVGELVYSHLQGQPLPPTTFYGDLGIELARRILQSAVFADEVRAYRPASAGRATVYGLLRHSTEISGTTLFLPRPETLPLAEVPILGSISGASSDAEIRDVLDLARRSSRGACIRIVPAGPVVGRIFNPSSVPGRIDNPSDSEAAAVRQLGQRIAHALRVQCYPAELPLVLLLRENLGKVLGHYVSEWGALPVNLMVIDEVAMRDAQFLQVGRLHNQVLPVSFYGLNQQGDVL